MKNLDSKHRQHSKGVVIITGCIFIVIAFPIYVFMSVKDFIKNKLIQTKSYPQKIKKDFFPSCLVQYKEPKEPVDNNIFISQIDEFVCFQYKSFNGLSGRGKSCQIVSDVDSELKDYMLGFLKKHPIEGLLYGNVNCDGYDMDHWEMCFIFENQNLNRRITGYGITEDSAPFLCEMIPYLYRKSHSNDRNGY